MQVRRCAEKPTVQVRGCAKHRQHRCGGTEVTDRESADICRLLLVKLWTFLLIYVLAASVYHCCVQGSKLVS